MKKLRKSLLGFFLILVSLLVGFPLRVGCFIVHWITVGLVALDDSMHLWKSDLYDWIIKKLDQGEAT